MQRALTGGRRANSRDGLHFWLQPSFTSIQPGFLGIYGFPSCFSFPSPPTPPQKARKTLGHQLMRHGRGVVPFGARWVEQIHFCSFKMLNRFLLFKAKTIATLLAHLFFYHGAELSDPLYAGPGCEDPGKPRITVGIPTAPSCTARLRQQVGKRACLLTVKQKKTLRN